MEKRWSLPLQRFDIMHEIDGSVIGIVSKKSCHNHCTNTVRSESRCALRLWYVERFTDLVQEQFTEIFP
jgi:hypothetical protein